MVNETAKILHKNIEVSATCVRVPVLRSHSEALTIPINNELKLKMLKTSYQKHLDLSYMMIYQKISILCQ